MYDINTKNVKKGKSFYFLFLFLGLLFLIIMGSVLISNYIKLHSLDSSTTSTSVIVNSYIDDEGATLYSPTYYYKVDGKQYSCPSNLSSSINPGTSNKIVYYDSKDHSNCMTKYSMSGNKFILLFMLLPLAFVIIAIVNMHKISKRIKLINELNQKGKLIKNLPYHLEGTGMSVNNIQIKRPVIDYTLPYGSVITLYGDPRHDRKFADADGMVDLVIDENNPDNYFIDFEINRLSGNLPNDYYNNPQQINQNIAEEVNQANINLQQENSTTQFQTQENQQNINSNI